MRKERINYLKGYLREIKKWYDLKNYEEMLYDVDMVNGFVRKGALHDEHIALAIPAQIELIEYVKEEGQGYAFIKDFHDKDSVEFKTFLKHCESNTDEVMLVSELRPYEDDALVYLKNCTSAMYAPRMIKDLKRMKKLKVVIGVGCCTDICVMNFLIALKNYFNQMNRDIDIFVVRSATDTYHIPGVHDREEYENMAYKLMEQAGIIVVDDINELIKRKEEMGYARRRRMN